MSRVYKSPNYDNRTAPISILVMHYTGMKTGAAALDRLCDPEAKVSAHYCIEENGALHQLVDEQYRAWHAGVGSWRAETDVNNVSIGIELVNRGHKYGYTTFPKAQIDTLIKLSTEILERHNIAPHNIIGHSDLAPDRKEDPGELFPWQELAHHNIGFFPVENSVSEDIVKEEYFLKMLEKYGYAIEHPDKAISAFQRRFCVEELGQGIGPVSSGRLINLMLQCGNC